MSKSYLISGKTLLLPSGTAASFDHPIKTDAVAESGDVLIVALDVPPNAKMNRNVFGVSVKSGEILWQIEDVWQQEDSPFTGVYAKGDVVDLYNWSGFTVTVKPTTGEILSKKLTK